MTRHNRLAFAAALLIAGGPALAWEPEVIGLDEAAAPGAALVAAPDAAPSWEPEIIGLDADALGGAYLPRATADVMAFVQPPLVDSGDAPAGATPLAASAPSPAAAVQLACSCASR